MNINSATAAEKSNSAAASKSEQSEKDENQAQSSFTDEYKLLLAQNGLNLGITDQNMLMAIATQNGTNKSEFLGYANSLQSVRSAFNYDTLTISKDDARFFSDMVEKTDYVVAANGDGATFQANLLKAVSNENTKTLKSSEVSKSLMNLIEEAYKTGKPARIDFDNNVSVILRIGRDGKVSADFIPGDKAVEQYLKNNIGYLKQSFEDQNLEYGDIMYKPYNQNGGKRQRNNQNNNGGQQ